MIRWLVNKFSAADNITFRDHHGLRHVLKILKNLNIDTSSFENDSGNLQPYEIESFCIKMMNSRNKRK